MDDVLSPTRIVAMLADIVDESDVDQKRRLAGELVAALHRSGMLARWVHGARAKTDLGRDMDEDLLQDAAERLLTKLVTSARTPEPDKVLSALYHLVLGAVKDVARSPARRDGRTGLTTTARRGAAWRAEWQRMMRELGREPTDTEVADRLNLAGKDTYDGRNHIVPPMLDLDEQRDEPSIGSMPVEAIARDLAVIVAGRIDDPKLSAEVTASATQWALAVSSGLIDPTSASDLATLRGMSYYLARKHLAFIEEAISAYRETPV